MNKHKYLPYIMGVGLILFMVHSPAQPLKEYLFLPQIGLFILIGCIIYALYPWRSITLGSRWIWIPMMVIVGSMAIRVALDPSQHSLGTLLMGLVLFGVYLTARKLGSDIFKVFVVVVVIEALSVIALGLIDFGVRNGGIINYPTRNYDVATGLLVFGSLVCMFRGQWIVATLAFVALVFTGSEEAVLAIVVLGGAVLIRRDWGKRLLLPVGVMLCGIILLFTTGGMSGLFDAAFKKIDIVKSLWTNEEFEGQYWLTRDPAVVDDGVFPRTIVTGENGDLFEITYDYEWEEKLDNAMHWRWTQYKRAAQNIAPFGNGYEVTDFSLYTVHNVPFIIVDQIGILAAIAWLFITIYCLVKTKWKYAFIAILSLGLLDHFVWTQCAPWWWALVGVATASNIKSDLIFKKTKEEE